MCIRWRPVSLICDKFTIILQYCCHFSVCTVNVIWRLFDEVDDNDNDDESRDCVYSVLWCIHLTDDTGFEPVTVESLRVDKVFVKLVKKQQKELESLNKMHVKERSTLQKQQCTVMDKMIAVHEKEKQQVEKVTEKGGKKKLG